MSRILITLFSTGAFLLGYASFSQQTATQTPSKERELIEVIPFQPGETTPKIVFPKCKYTVIKLQEAEEQEKKQEDASVEQASGNETTVSGNTDANVQEKQNNPDEEIIKSLRQVPKHTSSRRDEKNINREEKLPNIQEIEVLKKSSSELRKIIDQYETMKPEEIKINAKFSGQAADLRNIIEDIGKELKEKKQEATNLNREYKRAGEEMRSPRKNEEAVAWYYISDKYNCRHPMKEKPSPARGPVKYVLPADDRGQKARKDLKPDVERVEMELKELTEKYSRYKQRYLMIKKDYKAYLEKKNAELLNQIKEAEAQVENISGKKTEEGNSASTASGTENES